MGCSVCAKGKELASRSGQRPSPTPVAATLFAVPLPVSLRPLSCSMPMVALNPYYHEESVQYEALFYWWLQIALGIGAAAAASLFIFPITAGACLTGEGLCACLYADAC